MPNSESFEHLIDGCAHCIGDDYDPETGTVTAFVTQKVPEDQLDKQDVIDLNEPNRQTDVEEIGDVAALGINEEMGLHDDIQAQSAEHTGRHRPVSGGLSEGLAHSQAGGTGGPFPAEVTDLDAPDARWNESIDEGMRIRVSNAHVYCSDNPQAPAVNKPDGQRQVAQPAPIDARSGAADTENIIGNVVGAVPIQDGTRADCAARTSTTDIPEPGSVDSDEYHNLADEYGQEVRRDYSNIAEEALVKSGRTTGVLRGDVRATSASVRVRYGSGEDDRILLRDQIITDHMSEPGDSGSAVFDDASGALVGLLFAGSQSVTLCNKITNVENALGVEFLPADRDAGEDGDEGGSGNGSDGDSGDGSGGDTGDSDQPDDGSGDGGEDDEDDDPDVGSEASFEDYVEELLIDEYGADNVERQYYLDKSERYADFLVFDESNNRIEGWELENTAGSVISGSGQAIYYAQEAMMEFPDSGTAVPVLCVPDGHIDPRERHVIEQMGVTVREITTPESVSLQGV